MITTMTTKRPTLATLKAFVRANQGQLYIRHLSHFDAMTDGVEQSDDKSAHPVQSPERGHAKHDLGIAGVWLVGQSRDSIAPVAIPGFAGYHVYNSCGSFDLLVATEN